MEFPVDMLGSIRPEEEEQAAHRYMTQLRYISLDQIRISLSNVGFMPIYGGDLKHKILALFAPDDQLTAVALFLAGQWWSIEDLLKTSDPSRTGLIKVRSLGERIILYVLNRIVYRVGEMDQPEVPFLCHGQHEFAKLLWKDGHAIGFYSVKPKDSLCSNFVTQRYQLPVMDSIFVRKRHRGNGHGLEMLEDFVDSFKDDQLGLKYPLSLTMYKVCRQYLCRYPADQDLLWVVEGVGGPYQRESISSKIKSCFGLEISGLIFLYTTHIGMKMFCSCVVLDETPLSPNRSGSHNKRSREEMEDFTDESQPLKMNRSDEEFQSKKKHLSKCVRYKYESHAFSQGKFSLMDTFCDIFLFSPRDYKTIDNSMY
uniref:N-acetyltransferase domain-containing protein n=1 Tax=Esox lucius TaxID=8010 RepID=A0A3P8XCD7_ESOLU